MRTHIESLLESGLTGHEISKATGIPRNTIYRLMKGQSDLDNITLKNAELLFAYYCALRDAYKPLALSVYVADNRDVFMTHGNVGDALNPVNVYELRRMGLSKLQRGNVIHCRATYGMYEGVSYIGYSTVDGAFIGHADVHITDTFSPDTDGLYLLRDSERTRLGDAPDDVLQARKNQMMLLTGSMDTMR